MKVLEINPRGERTVIMLAGYMFNAWSLAPLAHSLSSYRVFCIDSICADTYKPNALQAFCQTLAQFISSRAIVDPILVGYSFGGFAAQLFCKTFPSICDKLILLGSCAPWDHTRFNFSHGLRFMRYLFTLERSDFFYAAMFSILSPASQSDTTIISSIQKDFLSDFPNARLCTLQLLAMRRLAQAAPHFNQQVSTYLIYAIDDRVIPPAQSRLASNSFAKLEFTSVPGTHFFVYENHELVADHITNWIEQ